MAGRASTLLRNHALLAASLAICSIVYARVILYPSISWDDPEMVFRNYAVREFSFAAFFSNHYVGNYLPLTMTGHALTWLFFGHAAWGHHLVNLLFHLANGVLVYSLSQRLFITRSHAVLAAVIFLLHPLQVETVAWISELKNCLYVFFLLLSSVVYIQYLRKQKSLDLLLSIFLFILACLSKPAAIIFPLLILCYNLILEKTLSKKHLLLVIPYFIISILFGSLMLYTQAEDRFINYSHAYPILQRIGMAGYALLRYFTLFLFPSRLSVIYPYPDPEPRYLFSGYIFIILLAALFIISIRKRNYVPAVLICFSIANLILVLQLVPFGEALYADRYIYLAVVGMAWLLAWLINQIKIDFRLPAVMLLLLLGSLTYARNGKWENAITLYEDILKKYPGNFVALNSAGVEAMRMDDNNKARVYFQSAIKNSPANYKGYYNLGLLYLKTQKPGEAIQQFSKTIELYPYAKAHIGRATAYVMMREFALAIEDAQKALELEPENAKAHYILGSCYNDMNQLQQALAELNKAIVLDNSDGEFYFKRAIVRGKMQDFRTCAEDLKLALHFRPELHEAYYWLGVAKYNLGQDPCADFRTAVGFGINQALKAYNKMCR